ncbi:MAG: serine aminopeptidase domain-containing protein [Streptosporangiaceae bacterium]
MESTSAAAALAVIEMAGQGRFEEIRERFAPQLRPMVPAEALRSAWEAELARSGQVASVGAAVTEPAGPGGGVLVKVPVTFERGTLTVAVGLAGEEDWITGIQLLPASAVAPALPWEPPGYADASAFTEQDVMVGDGPLAVGGTLSLPRSGGAVPGVVLLAGSGPNDRDETIGRNKPLKDLAWGLASAGVAVLRFDKVTFAHPEQVAGNRGFTLADEYVPDAVAAIEVLAGHAGRIFVAGHSLGGTVAPRVAAALPSMAGPAMAGPSVAGLVILAGGAEPLHWAAVRQFRYLASLDPSNAAAAAAAQPALDVIERQARAVDDPGLSETTPDSELPFGVPAAYWLDVRAYDPGRTAAELGLPMLLVQGGRDYQVTVADDLSRWRDALDGRPDVTFRVYEADNHLFFPGSGPSSPAEYEPAQHVDAEVVAGIAAWIRSAFPASG